MEMFLVGLSIGVFIGAIAAHCAYCNGVIEGFGFAAEPGNPGYRKAGRYLRKLMSYRWPELRNGIYSDDVVEES